MEYQLWLLVLAWTLIKVWGFDSCLHSQNSTVWNCSSSARGGLKFFWFPESSEIPAAIPLQVLDLSYNAIKHIPKINLTITGKLLLNNNNIQSIEEDAFETLRQLTTLDLSRNKINGSFLNEKTFQGLHGLKELYLRMNPIHFIGLDVFLFTELKSLETLDLSNCSIKQIHLYALQHLPRLRTLDLSWNDMTSLPMNVFDGLFVLQTLNLTGNLLYSIEMEVQFLPSLQYLLLGRNNIRHIDANAFDKKQHLLYLSLADNKLLRIPSGALQNIGSIHYLNMSNNPMNVISDPLLHYNRLINVYSLQLDNMPNLKAIMPNAFTNFRNLSTLSIKNNGKLTFIGARAFYGDGELISEVTISNNALRTLPGKLFNWSALKCLTLREHWHCNCSMRWATRLQDSDLKLSRCWSPLEFRGRDVRYMSAKELNCPTAISGMVAGVIFGVIGLILLTSLGLVLLYNCRNKLPHTHSIGDEYAIVFDREDEDNARILMHDGDDLIPLKSAAE